MTGKGVDEKDVTYYIFCTCNSYARLLSMHGQARLWSGTSPSFLRCFLKCFDALGSQQGGNGHRWGHAMSEISLWDWQHSRHCTKPRKEKGFYSCPQWLNRQIKQNTARNPEEGSVSAHHSGASIFC